MAGLLAHQLEQLLKLAGLSPSHYDVLEILFDAGPAGLACHQIAERMTSRDPDVTRILDRLASRRLISRERESTDRRVIRTRIAPEGSRLLRKLKRSVTTLHAQQLRHLGDDRLRQLLELLAIVQGSETTRRGSKNEVEPILPPGPDR